MAAGGVALLLISEVFMRSFLSVVMVSITVSLKYFGALISHEFILCADFFLDKVQSEQNLVLIECLRF